MFRLLAVSAALTLAAVVPVTAALGASDRAAGDQSCHGHPATLVGQPGQDLKGTDGTDVILTNGAASVEAGDGDDLICVTGGTGYVLDGDGNDDIDTTGEPADDVTLTELSGGNDTFTGGSGTDDVTVIGGGDDVIDTGGGDDHVQVADGSDIGSGNSLRVDLGPGNDMFSSVEAPIDSQIDGGTGHDTIRPPSDEDASTATWDYDDVQGAAFRDGIRVQSWSSFETFDLQLTGKNVTFYGSDLPEDVRSSGDTPATYLLGGGNDVADVGLSASFDIQGGPGEDTVAHVQDTIRTGDQLKIDLFHGIVTYAPAGQHAVTGTVEGMEDEHVSKLYEANLIGDNSANKLIARSVCNVTSQGRGGNDLIRLQTTQADCPGARLNGGAGDDRLIGGLGDDRLKGGPGRDVANGKAGVDFCQAEVEIGCEKH